MVQSALVFPFPSRRLASLGGVVRGFRLVPVAALS
jgi:hypothetical protein